MITVLNEKNRIIVSVWNEKSRNIIRRWKSQSRIKEIGGGSFFVLYKDVEVYREVNRRFYHNLLEKTYSLRVLTTYIDHIDFDDYPTDRGRLYSRHLGKI